MAIEGAYNAQQFTAGRPDALSWQQHMLYWDTQNPFSAGNQGVRNVGTSPFQQTRSGVHLMSTDVPIGTAPRAQVRPLSMFGNSRSISSGGRNYGTQSIDRGELGRIGSFIGPAFARNATGSGQGSTRTTTSSTGNTGQTPSNLGRLQQSWRKRQLTKQGIPMPPQPTAQAPGTLSPPVLPTPHANATSNWRAEQAQRIADNLNQVGRAPVTNNPTLEDTQRYQQERAQERIQNTQRRAAEASVGTGGAPPPPPATSDERWANAQRRIAAQQATRNPPTEPLPQAVPSRPAPSITPSPMTAVGGQEERLAAEVAQPTTPVNRPGSVGTVPIKTPSLLLPPKPI